MDGSAKVIGQTDLLVHNRIQNMEVNEWLKEAAEVTVIPLSSVSVLHVCPRCTSLTEAAVCFRRKVRADGTRR